MSDTPPYVVHLDDVAEVEGTYPPPFDAEKLTIYRDLGRAAGTRNVGFGHERLLPGRRSSFTHAHELEEEFVLVLEGTCHLRVIEPGAAPREIPLRKGHAVAFPPGTGIAHCFVNRGDAECLLFIAGERRRDDRWFYPEDADYEAHFARTRGERHWDPGAKVRRAEPDDAATILAFLHRKADFDRANGAFDGELATTEEAIRESMFGSTRFAHALLATGDDGAVEGMALYYFRYSSFRGQPSLWLDDLYVLEGARGRGVGAALMAELVRIARAHRASHLGWTASVNNPRGIAFYERLGARIAERGPKQVRFELVL
jgi:uncharacterized cupin superfamily protein/L-amino acid N-acyltransferase YncA